MSISPGVTVAEIREIVHEYQKLPYGQKAVWRAERALSYKTLRRWQSAVYAGDLDRGLVPRQGSYMSTPQGKRTALARAAEQAAHTTEVTKLNARVRELEDTNRSLGKAIGLLHAISEEEPAITPTTPNPSGS